MSDWKPNPRWAGWSVACRLARNAPADRVPPPPVEVIRELRALREEFPDQRRYVDQMLMMARFGRGRDKLGPDFVAKVRSWCEQVEAMEPIAKVPGHK
jgi:hypothetical protein